MHPHTFAYSLTHLFIHLIPTHTHPQHLSPFSDTCATLAHAGSKDSPRVNPIISSSSHTLTPQQRTIKIFLFVLDWCWDDIAIRYSFPLNHTRRSVVLYVTLYSINVLCFIPISILSRPCFALLLVPTSSFTLLRDILRGCVHPLVLDIFT
jgi:hypothetical protein